MSEVTQMMSKLADELMTWIPITAALIVFMVLLGIIIYLLTHIFDWLFPNERPDDGELNKLPEERK